MKPDLDYGAPVNADFVPDVVEILDQSLDNNSKRIQIFPGSVLPARMGAGEEGNLSPTLEPSYCPAVAMDTVSILQRS